MPVSMLLGAAALLFIVAIAGCDQSGSQTPEQLQVEACHADWRKCRDNKEIVYTWAGGPGGITPRVTCEFAANDLAKYGTPEWPGFPAYSFNNFFSSTSKSALAKGHLILEHIDVALIDRARHEIDMAAYVLTDWPILQARPFDREALWAQTQRADRMKPLTSCLASWRTAVQPA